MTTHPRATTRAATCRWLAVAACALLLLLDSGQASGQVRGHGAKADSATRILQQVLARREYLRIERDTVLPTTFHAPGDLLIVGAEVRLEGRVEGAVAVLDGALFLRPGAHVGGPIAAVRGEVLASGKASHGPIVETPWRYTAHLSGVEPDFEAVIVPPPPPPRLKLRGIAGVGPPVYDRVSGLSLRAATDLRLSEQPGGAVLGAMLSYQAARTALDGGANLQVPVGEAGLATLGLERTTLSNEVWSSGDFYNSLAVVLAGRDYRNYFAEDRATLRLERLALVPLIAGESAIAPRLVLLAARDRSLKAYDVWSLTQPDSGWRPNPPIDEGTLVSATAGAALRWRGTASALRADLELEQGVGGLGDFAFTQVRGETSVHVRSFGQQTMAIYARGVAPLDGGAPRQRWEILGGGATLPTLAIGAHRGDHLAFVRSEYTILLPRLALPKLGPPAAQLLYAAGSAWATGEDPPTWTQNLGAGLAVRFVRARLYVDPAHTPLRPVFVLALAWR